MTSLPGIEIDLENGHILLISENKELDDFAAKCNLVQAELITNTDFITASN